jgi:hypothetical protein
VARLFPPSNVCPELVRTTLKGALVHNSDVGCVHPLAPELR